MLKDTDKTKFLQAQQPELRGLQKMDVFDIKPMASKPSHAKLLSSIWSYREKRSRIGIILKYKAHLCMDESQQQHGLDYWETYASVVSWSTIHLILLLSNILNLKSCQVDSTQAFPQAPLDDPIYRKMPQGWLIDTDGMTTSLTNQYNLFPLPIS